MKAEFLLVLSIYMNGINQGKKLDARPVIKLKEHKININVINLSHRESSLTPANYDPRLFYLQFADAKVLDNLKANLLYVNQRSVIITFLFPVIKGFYMIIHTAENLKMFHIQFQKQCINHPLLQSVLLTQKK